MEVPPPFPILKLPFVALWNVIRSMGIKETVDLSFTSKRLVTIIKSIPLADPEIILAARPDEQPSFFPEEALTTTEDVQKMIDYMGGKQGSEMGSKHSSVFANYICALYRKDIFALQINVNTSSPVLTSLLEWMNDRQADLNSCLIYGDCNCNEITDQFFKKREFSIRQLCLNLKLSPEIKPFNFGILEMEEFVVRTMDVTDPIPNWITVDSVLTSNCIIMYIGASPLTGTDLNRIIKGWINGNNPRMEFFYVVVKQFNLRSLLDGIEFEKRETTVKRIYIPEDKHFEFQRPITKRTIVGGYDIRRSDGTVATFKVLHRPQNQGVLWFVMVVWKKTVDS
ncbi:hypothetical protein GCK72_012763 [Caenorhabditis remanei]|uniref:F-box domain-containing protein n=1 Tax=Caenorhabditis remanei TaxID=31234 RepID=A0A6A5GLV7_CAERE|nr:hypothetical protein GCK72_012763 [Caenorhabditis remanei]KAF1756310.1 hypothetical protein GCK72_012763 [Caenorhabditis remanei]